MVQVGILKGAMVIHPGVFVTVHGSVFDGCSIILPPGG
jgi:hypothetical protein